MRFICLNSIATWLPTIMNSGFCFCSHRAPCFEFESILWLFLNLKHTMQFPKLAMNAAINFLQNLEVVEMYFLSVCQHVSI